MNSESNSNKSTLNELVPQNKIDMARAEAVVALGFPAVEPILSELVEWLKDCNWPVAHVLAPFLGKIGLPLLSHICHVLSTDDEIWKYWVLSCLVEPSPPADRRAQSRVRTTGRDTDG